MCVIYFPDARAHAFLGEICVCGPGGCYGCIRKLRFIQFASSNFFFHIQMFSPRVSYCRSHTCTREKEEKERTFAADRPRSGICVCNPFSRAMELYICSLRATFFFSGGARASKGATAKMSNLHVDLILRINISAQKTMCTHVSVKEVADTFLLARDFDAINTSAYL